MSCFKVQFRIERVLSTIKCSTKLHSVFLASNPYHVLLFWSEKTCLFAQCIFSLRPDIESINNIYINIYMRRDDNDVYSEHLQIQKEDWKRRVDDER